MGRERLLSQWWVVEPAYDVSGGESGVGKVLFNAVGRSALMVHIMPYLAIAMTAGKDRGANVMTIVLGMNRDSSKPSGTCQPTTAPRNSTRKSKCTPTHSITEC